jgi:predicted AlkP superfamily pyrophosphatase or phosphodiesterase
MLKPWLSSFLATYMFFFCASAAAQNPGTGSGGRNTPQQASKPYLVLVSLDGFRWDYPERFKPQTIQKMMRHGFRAERMIPVFPTLTFPNHYSIATGLYPEHHGLVANYFRAPGLHAWYELRLRDTVEDGRFYGGEPIWVSAERQGMVTAAYFFVGTEAAIQGIRPTHWRSFTKSVSGEERVDQVLAWLNEPEITRPHFVTLYFEDVDDHSHWSGVGSHAAREAIQTVDRHLNRLLTGIRTLPYGDQVNVLVVSDHGQSSYRIDSEPLVLEEHIDLSGIRVIGKGSYAFLNLAQADPQRISRMQQNLESAWHHGRVLTPAQAPASWNIGSNPRWPDLMVLPDPGYAVVSSRDQIDTLNPGAHGWPPEFPDMHGVLFGLGPAFRKGARTGPVRAVDIYPMMLQVLGLKAPASIDGDSNALRSVLTSG